MTKIAVLGMGAMGSRMAARLLDAGHDVRVWNRSVDRAKSLMEKGATLASSPRDAVEDREVVISMVRDDAASRAVWLEAGALEAMPRDAVAIESSTLTPDWIAELSKAASSRKVAFLDAPVAGTRPQADAGQLIYVVGGETEALDVVRPVLDVMGGTVHHVGPNGAGTAMKLAINSLFGIQVAALAETLGLLRRTGIEDADAVEVLASMPITSPAMAGVGGLMVAKKFAPMFPIDLVEKDFAYVETAAKTLGTTVPVASKTRQVFEKAKTEGLADENIVAVAKLY